MCGVLREETNRMSPRRIVGTLPVGARRSSPVDVFPDDGRPPVPSESAIKVSRWLNTRRKNAYGVNRRVGWICRQPSL